MTHIEDQADDSAGSDETTPNDITFSERPNKDDGWRQAARGSKPGDRYVRACRPHGFQRRELDIRAQRSDESRARAGETLAFAQAGTADRRLEMKPAHRRRSAYLFGIGTTATAIVAIAIATRFLDGAWLVLALIALLILVMTTIYWSIQRFAKPISRISR